jgi:hypothetical protein
MKWMMAGKLACVIIQVIRISGWVIGAGHAVDILAGKFSPHLHFPRR